MSDTPNEIWCDTGLYYDYKTDWSEGSWRNNANWGGVKYVRADRIKELEAENKLLSEGATVAHFQGVMYARENMADRIEELEAKLAKAVEMLAAIIDDNDNGMFVQDHTIEIARTTLAELKGEDRG